MMELEDVCCSQVAVGRADCVRVFASPKATRKLRKNHHNLASPSSATTPSSRSNSSALTEPSNGRHAPRGRAGSAAQDGNGGGGRNWSSASDGHARHAAQIASASSAASVETWAGTKRLQAARSLGWVAAPPRGATWIFRGRNRRSTARIFRGAQPKIDGQDIPRAQPRGIDGHRRARGRARRRTEQRIPDHPLEILAKVEAGCRAASRRTRPLPETL